MAREASHYLDLEDDPEALIKSKIVRSITMKTWHGAVLGVTAYLFATRVLGLSGWSQYLFLFGCLMAVAIVNKMQEAKQ